MTAEKDSPPSRALQFERVLDAMYWPLMAGIWLIILLSVASYFSTMTVLDDAYMFERYADHLLAEGRIAGTPAARRPMA
jgi:hypothetical protein